jgi:hypothetical protein
LGNYFPARIFGPLRGAPNSGAKTQKSNTPAKSGTAPTIATTIPVVPPITHTPRTMSAAPATIRTIRPVVEAMNFTKGFMIASPLSLSFYPVPTI